MSHGVFAGLFAQRTSRRRLLQPMQFAPPEVTLAEVAAGATVDRSFEFALDALPCNAMFCDRDLILRYLNGPSRKTLHSLEQHLPVPVDQLVGKSIHIFHRAPGKCRQDSGRKATWRKTPSSAQGHHRIWGPSSSTRKSSR